MQNKLGSYSLHAAAILGDVRLLRECMPKVQDLELRNKEREALKTLPALIETLETERDHLATSLNSPEYYRDTSNDPTRDAAHLSSLETRISNAYEQWGVLETLSADQ